GHPARPLERRCERRHRRCGAARSGAGALRRRGVDEPHPDHGARDQVSLTACPKLGRAPCVGHMHLAERHRLLYIRPRETSPHREAAIWKGRLYMATKPAVRPSVPHFSSGPCAKRPGWTPQNLKDAALGRSHRAKVGKAKLKLAIDLTR